MNDPWISNSADFDGPAEYRILVQGRLGERWRDRVGGLELSVHEEHAGEPQTELTGLLRDQAALMGVLQHLYARGVAIVSVELVKRQTGAGRSHRAVSPPDVAMSNGKDPKGGSE